MILRPLQKLPKNVGDLGKSIVAEGFEKLPKVQKIVRSGHTAAECKKLSLKYLAPRFELTTTQTWVSSITTTVTKIHLYICATNYKNLADLNTNNFYLHVILASAFSMLSSVLSSSSTFPFQILFKFSEAEKLMCRLMMRPAASPMLPCRKSREIKIKWMKKWFNCYLKWSNISLMFAHFGFFLFYAASSDGLRKTQ